MKKVLTVFFALVALHSTATAAECPLLKTYDTTLVPVCDAKDMYIKWPNYVDQYTYYTCQGVNSPVLVNCPGDQVFIYVLQECGPCSSYIPPVPCAQLKTQNPPQCEAIGSNVPTDSPGNSFPTPNYPTSAPTTTTTTKTTTTTTTTTTPSPDVPSPPTEGPVETTTTTINSGNPTPPVENTPDPSESTIPPPPSPATNAPGVVTPPTPAPTPPSVSAGPPEDK